FSPRGALASQAGAAVDTIADESTAGSPKRVADIRVECPACGQRIEMTGRQVYCPNCGQLVEVRTEFQPPLPPRQAKEEPIEALEDVSGSVGQGQPKLPPPAPAAGYAPPPPDREAPAWLPATLLILPVVVGWFLVLDLGSLLP